MKKADIIKQANDNIRELIEMYIGESTYDEYCTKRNLNHDGVCESTINCDKCQELHNEERYERLSKKYFIKE